MLAALLRDAVAADRPVLLTAAAEPVLLSTLLRQAAAIQAALPPPTPGSMVAFAFADDRAAFAAALLGTWLAGHGAALPENAARERVVPVLSRPEVVAFLHDTGVGRGLFVPRLLAAAGAGSLPEAAPWSGERTLLATFTACADGSTKAAAWTARELLADVDRLVEQLQLDADSGVVTGLLPSYAPAVLAALLAPLRCGGRVMAAVPRRVEDLLALAQRTASARLLLPPAWLRQLAKLPDQQLHGLRHVTCAGIASPRAAARLAALGIDVSEVGLDWIEGTEPELEACAERLCGIDGVTDAALLPLPAGDAAASEVLVAVAAPAALHDELLRQARAALPPGLTPRLCTFAQLPREANGSLLHADVFLGCGLGRDGRPVVRTLAWREVESRDGSRRFATAVPERYAFFEGHFVPYPVMAGVVQLHELVLPCVRAVQPDLGPLQRLGAIKFQARIAPGDHLEVVVRRAGSGSGSDREFDFEICRGELRCASGRLTFAAAAAEAP